MIGDGVAVDDDHVLLFLIFGKLLKLRFALLQIAGDCCFLRIPGSQVIGELLKQDVVLPRIPTDILSHGYFVRLRARLGLY